ncbi:MAG: NADH-quinone oxidoreductase subunit NuoN [Xanthomonadaceae bacterium]|nr:NADH-quinone oxidoreductase subunit NuoN [Xanthomonadaceae bacterium]MDE2083295.1 NADH-quinone oxidoreductase subunit NuoN [Xanthomonadaceae bacterium]
MNFNLHDLIVLAPEDFLLGATCAILFIDLFLKQSQRAVTHWLSIAALLGTLGLVLADHDPARLAFNGAYIHDTVAAVLKVFILGIVAMVFVFVRRYLAERKLFVGEFYTLTLFSTLGMLLLVSAGNLVMVYLGLELFALSSYALVAIHRDSGVASEAAMKYFVLGALASGLLLYGLSMIYGATGTLDLAQIRQVGGVGVNGLAQHPTLLAFGLVFVVVGVAFKFGAAPFHMWLPDVYEGSPTAVTIFIGSAPKLAAFGMAYRLLDSGLGSLAPHWSQMLAALAALSLIIGNLVAIAQTNIKRMLAYSTISHMGFLLLGLLNATPSGYAAAMFYAICYAFMTTAAFGVILLLSRAGFEAEMIDDFKGLNQRNPWYAFVMLLAMFSLAGVPPLWGFFAKLLVLKAAIDAGFLWLAMIAIGMAIVGCFYYLRVVKAMYFDAPADKSALVLPQDLPLRWLLSINGFALIALGVLWGPLIGWCYRAFGL